MKIKMGLKKSISGLWRRSFRPRRSLRVGLALGADRIVAVELKRRPWGPKAGRVHARPLAAPAEDGTWPDLTAALEELKAELGADSGTAAIALLRPLAKAKVIPVPPVKRRDLRPLITRNARRYFVAGSGPLVVDAVPLGRRGPARLRALAVWAEAGRLRAIEAAVQAAGFEPTAMSAAPVAIARAVALLVRGAGQGPTAVAVRGRDWREGIAMQAGKPRLLEPWSGVETNATPELLSRLAETGLGGAEEQAAVTTVVLASTEEREAIATRVAEEFGAAPLAAGALDDLEPEAAAALGAALLPDDAPQLLLPELRRIVERRIHTRVVGFCAAAAVALVVAAGLHRWGVERELAAVTAAHLAHAPKVNRAIEQRQTAELLRARLAAVARLESESLPWTPTVAALATTLPDSAYLITLSAEGLKLRLAGIAASASAVVPALESSPLLREVSLTTARRRQGAAAGEDFDLDLALRPLSALVPAAGPQTGRPQ